MGREVDPIEDFYRVACGYLRGRFPSTLRSRFDIEDFVQDAIVDVLVRGGEISQLPTIARRRMIDAMRQQQSKKYGGSRHSGQSPDRTPSRLPTAEQVAVARETWERLLRMVN